MNHFLRSALIGLIAISLLINGNMNYKNIGVECGFIRFQDFHSQSFVPNGLHISYRIENGIGIDYNITVLQAFPGKILTSIFIRKVPNTADEKSTTVLKYKNLDFCKIIEMAQTFNMNTRNETILENTFITSCPLIRGFYYIKNGTLRTEGIPATFARGIYWVQLELVQVFGEVTKLMNVRMKCDYVPPTSDIFNISEEYNF